MHGVIVSGAVAYMHGRLFDLRAGLNHTHWLVLSIVYFSVSLFMILFSNN